MKGTRILEHLSAFCCLPGSSNPFRYYMCVNASRVSVYKRHLQFEQFTRQLHTVSHPPSTKPPILYSSDYALLRCITLHTFVGHLCGCRPCKEFSLSPVIRLPTFPFNHRSPKRTLSGEAYGILAANMTTSGTTYIMVAADMTTRAN